MSAADTRSVARFARHGLLRVILHFGGSSCNGAGNGVAELGNCSNGLGDLCDKSYPTHARRLSDGLCILFSARRLPRVLFSSALFYPTSAGCSSADRVSTSY